MAIEVDMPFTERESGVNRRVAVSALLKAKSARDYVSVNVYDGVRTKSPDAIRTHLKRLKKALQMDHKTQKQKAELASAE